MFKNFIHNMFCNSEFQRLIWSYDMTKFSVLSLVAITVIACVVNANINGAKGKFV